MAGEFHAMNRPAPTREDLDTFCRREGWQEVRNARGEHLTYELHLPDGRILRTRVSRPPDKATYGPKMWAHVLRDQLCISEAEFWACVKDGVVPGRTAPRVVAEAVPAQVVHLLIHQVRLREDEVAAMTRDEAIARVNRFWTEGG
ncbi:cytotoxic translational repressor of toxin-antitoxin stability system [Amycolatopsis jejuensis]|uniref:cytotoxic translational repressor of toxin-antitoxin stability system n=1 Tax=Amycolatopsis jejuensis TaxID=330084 RepID=UPI001FE20C81|nr:cytotoxic translational repressor of toxin-antitoxin stability system [Amycolatopsis jejuensis]